MESVKKRAFEDSDELLEAGHHINNEKNTLPDGENFCDSSDEEDMRNTVGNIPIEWYDDFPHIGYNLDGLPITKPRRNEDELDKFVNKMENPNYWRTVYDRYTAHDHILSEEELDLLRNLKSGSFYSSSVNPYETYVDFFTSEKMIHPVNNYPAHKRSFTASETEAKKVGQLVHAIKMGWIKPRKPKPSEDEDTKYYDIWAETKDSTSHSELARQRMHVPAPKQALPGHEASYNPPPEFLLTEEEVEQRLEDEEKDHTFVPQKYDCIRHVPQYPAFIQERFARCLDLYLCPRKRKMKVNIAADDLIPDLPKPKDLQPFPTFQALCYKGHTSIIRSIAVDSTGQWLASGADDGSVRIWEISTARCVRHLSNLTDGMPVKCVSWCPNVSVCLLAIAFGNNVSIVSPCVGDRLVYQATDNLIQSYAPETEDEINGKTDEQSKANVLSWKVVESGLQYRAGQRLIIQHPKDVSKLAWHAKGDYFASVVPGNGHAQVFLHQLTKRRSQNPFSRCRGIVQCTLFHPHRPLLFVATQQAVKVYDLMKQQLVKKLFSNAKWISSLAIHPEGDNLLVGSYDCRLSWFDMDLSTKPYKTMRFHTRAIRTCAFHRKYPLFASGGDDGCVIVGHGKAYSDLMQDPLIVPVKVLKGHKVEKNIGVLDCCFHPHQPWVFSSAADNTIRLFS